MEDINYYINIIKVEKEWEQILNDLINEILSNSKLYGFTLDNEDLKNIIDSLKEKILNKDIKKLIKSDKEVYIKFNTINLKLKNIYNIPFSILDFIDYKNELMYIIKNKDINNVK